MFAALQAVGEALSAQAESNRHAQAHARPDPLASRRDAPAAARHVQPIQAQAEHHDHAPSTHLPDSEPMSEFGPSRRGPTPLPRMKGGSVDNWPVTFTGTESDYARIWLRGLLLTLLTLGFFMPWARIACRRYLLQHTHVAGHTLDDRRSPWQLLAHQSLCLSLLGSVALAAMGSGGVALLAATMVLAVWPMLYLVGLTDRIGHTTWGRRSLSFDATLAALYEVWGLPVLGLSVLVWLWHTVLRAGHPVAWMLWGVAFGVWVLKLPNWYWGCLRLRQSNIRMGPLRMHWKLQPDAISALVLQTLGGALLVLLLNLGVLCVAAAGWLWWHSRGATVAGGAPVGSFGSASVLLCGGVFLGVLASLWMVWPEAQMKLHALVWNRTGDRHVRVRCRLSMPEWVRMRRRHALLMLVTLGLYWPWAELQARRMCLHGTVLQSRVALSVLSASWPRAGR